MKALLTLSLAAVAAYSGWRAYDYWDHSPSRIAAQIEAVRQSHPDLDAHVEEYSDFVYRVAVPFRVLTAAGSLLAPIDQLRKYEMESDGQRYRPWEEIARRSVEAKILDVAMDAVMYAVHATAEVDSHCEEIVKSATAFRTASTATADSEATAEDIRALHVRSDDLAARLEEMNAFIVPAAAALEDCDRELASLTDWLGRTSTAGVDEGFVVAGMRTGVAAIRSAFAVPQTAMAGLAEQMEEDSIVLRDIAELASRVR